MLTVEDTFLISKRGIVVVGPLEDELTEFKIGDSLEICCPDGSSFQTQIEGIERFSLYHSGKNAGILLGTQVTKNDVPLKSILWLIAN